MLQMTRVSKAFRKERIETLALSDVSIEIRPHEFVSITGPSGSGKTTFLSIAGLLEEFDSGEYRLDGVDISNLGDRERSRLRNEKIGFVFQSFNLIHTLTVVENVEVPLHYRGVPARDRRKRALAALDRVGLSSRARHLPSELSGGQRQRVSIARAIVGEPKLVLADEPTGNLDTQMSQGVIRMLEQLHQDGATIALVTHDPALAARAQRQIHIVDGRIVMAEDVPAAPSIEDRTHIQRRR